MKDWGLKLVQLTEKGMKTQVILIENTFKKRSASAAGDLNLTNPNNYRAIRYADVLLMAAEAYNRGKLDDAKARGYLNQVRRRALRFKS
jgi:hypothetical protein